jgi:hypothetical protein
MSSDGIKKQKSGKDKLLSILHKKEAHLSMGQRVPETEV